jgi:transposase
MYMGNRRCSIVKEKKKDLQPRIQKGGRGADHEKGYSIAEASRNLGVEYSVLRRWKMQLADDPQNAFPGKGKRNPDDEALKTSSVNWNG